MALAEEKGLDTKGLTDHCVKNKIDNLRKKGKALVDKHIRPLIEKEKRLPTSSEAPEEQQLNGPLADIDWGAMVPVTRWPYFPVYWELFGCHPTWGYWSEKETGSDSDSSG